MAEGDKYYRRYKKYKRRYIKEKGDIGSYSRVARGGMVQQPGMQPVPQQQQQQQQYTDYLDIDIDAKKKSDIYARIRQSNNIQIDPRWISILQILVDNLHGIEQKTSRLGGTMIDTNLLDSNQEISLEKLCSLEYVWITGLTEEEKTKYFDSITSNKTKPKNLLARLTKLHIRLKQKAAVFKYLETFSAWKNTTQWIENIDTGQTRSLQNQDLEFPDMGI